MLADTLMAFDAAFAILLPFRASFHFYSFFLILTPDDTPLSDRLRH